MTRQRKRTTNFFKTPLSTREVYEATPASQEISLTELVAILGPKIPPDCAIRRFLHHAACQTMAKLRSGENDVNIIVARGTRRLIQMKLCQLRCNKFLDVRYSKGEMYVKRTTKARKEAHGTRKT